MSSGLYSKCFFSLVYLCSPALPFCLPLVVGDLGTMVVLDSFMSA